MEPYSVEFRGEVLAACDTKEERRLIALRFGVSESWVRRWQRVRTFPQRSVFFRPL